MNFTSPNIDNWDKFARFNINNWLTFEQAKIYSAFVHYVNDCPNEFSDHSTKLYEISLQLQKGLWS